MRNDMCAEITVGGSGIEVADLGLMDYGECLRVQQEAFDDLVRGKKGECGPGRERLLLVEHPPVVTLGRHADRGNLLLSPEMMKERGVDVYSIGRGGDVTFHGPGQLVVYPILDLERHRLGVKDYVSLLEETVILTLADYGIKGERVEGATGVWIGKDSPDERKICAIGVRCSRFCSMHGLALNVNTDLGGFGMINPCGFTDKGVTSIWKETGQPADMAEVKRRLSDIFLRLILPL